MGKILDSPAFILPQLTPTSNRRSSKTEKTYKLNHRFLWYFENEIFLNPIFFLENCMQLILFQNISILASLPPLFIFTVAYGMRSVTPHIPYPSASLRERSYASVALQPLPTASTFPLLFQFTFSQNFLFRAVAQTLSNRLLL